MGKENVLGEELKKRDFVTRFYKLFGKKESGARGAKIGLEVPKGETQLPSYFIPRIEEMLDESFLDVGGLSEERRGKIITYILKRWDTVLVVEELSRAGGVQMPTDDDCVDADENDQVDICVCVREGFKNELDAAIAVA